MDKYELRRLNLLRLVNKMGRGGRVKVAKAILKSPDYIARMLYPKDKAGHKGIGEDSVELLDLKFPGWQETDGSVFSTTQELRADYKLTNLPWPFKTLTPEQYFRELSQENRDLVESVAINLINARDAPEKRQTPEEMATSRYSAAKTA